jgi:diadenylate cyclase
MHNFTDLLDQISWLVWFKMLVQIFIICYAVLWFWRRIAGTHAERLVKGIMVLIAIALASWALQLNLIVSMLQHIIPAAVLALVIVFQPEIRRGLGYLGRVQTFKFDLSLSHTESTNIKRGIDQLIIAVKELSRNKTGALIVIEPPEGERDYLSPGTPVNADLSATLLLTIFFPKSPLHDGAVVIRKDKIVAAGVILPMTDNPKLSYKYGTRHRAAIGLSETYDGLCIVVSEETGAISAASRGMLARYNSAEDLADPIVYIYHQNPTETQATPLNSFLSLFGRGKTESDLEPARDATKDAARESAKDPSKESAKETGRNLPRDAARSDSPSKDREKKTDKGNAGTAQPPVIEASVALQKVEPEQA